MIAALTAGRAGARVILADEDFTPGGQLNAETFGLGHSNGADWAKATVAELATMPHVRLMPRTTLVGAFDHGIYAALERVSDHRAVPLPGKPRQIPWRVYSRHALLCAGDVERPIAFANNDRPGVMPAGALRSYANRWAVVPGQQVAVFPNNDDGLRSATDLGSGPIKLLAVMDAH